MGEGAEGGVWCGEGGVWWTTEFLEVSDTYLYDGFPGTGCCTSCASEVLSGLPVLPGSVSLRPCGFH